MSGDTTETRGSGTPRPAPTSAACLYLVLDAAHPTDGGARIPLNGVNQLDLGRGEARGAERDGTLLSVRLPDRAVSSRHARLSRVLGEWLLEDTGSKNGTFVNGSVEKELVLADGDLLELGNTFFLFRTNVPTDEAAEPMVEVRQRGLPGVATLVPHLARALGLLERAARSDVPVLVSGETGTGKELVARALHTLSGRKGRFVAVNCGALPDTLIETELFGYKKGAFSGATDDRLGLVRAAEGGTLFLDEIGDLAAQSQVVLLRVLQEREVLPVGGTQPMPVDLRVCSATHADLDALTEEGKFRADLAARLTGFRVELPPLRERREDLGLLVGAVLQRLAGDWADRLTLSCDASRALLLHDWPKNVRELELALKSALALCEETIEVGHLPADVARSGEPAAVRARALRRVLSEEEKGRRDELSQLLSEHGGNVSAVARAMGKARVQVQRWLKRYGLAAGAFKEDE